MERNFAGRRQKIYIELFTFLFGHSGNEQSFARSETTFNTGLIRNRLK